MRRFNNIVLSKCANVVVLVRNKEEYKEFIDYMNFKLDKKSDWNIDWDSEYTKSKGVHENGACLYINHFGWDTIEFCKRKDCTILPFDLVAEDYFPVLEGKELKVRDEVWDREENCYVRFIKTKLSSQHIMFEPVKNITTFAYLDININKLDKYLSWTKPEPEQIKDDKLKQLLFLVPDGCKYIAININGNMCAYINKPEFNDGVYYDDECDYVIVCRRRDLISIDGVVTNADRRCYKIDDIKAGKDDN